MYVVGADAFLQMHEAQPHQLLSDKGLLREYTRSPASATAAFVSHQWCGRRHPDPYFKQLRVLQDMLRHACAGTLAVDVDLYSSLVYYHRPCAPLRARGGGQWVLR